MSGYFREPNLFDRLLNRTVGSLVGLGFGLRHNYLLQVRGRKSGRLYSTPIDLLDFRGRRFLVAPRGRTQWVRNAETAGEVSLKKGARQEKFRIRPVSDNEKPEILQAYVARFKLTVQRFFPVQAGGHSILRRYCRTLPGFRAAPSRGRGRTAKRRTRAIRVRALILIAANRILGVVEPEADTPAVAG
jgi:deazaflavin-dependent oxidoreductase (nitroreductase family)